MSADHLGDFALLTSFPPGPGRQVPPEFEIFSRAVDESNTTFQAISRAGCSPQLPPSGLGLETRNPSLEALLLSLGCRDSLMESFPCVPHIVPTGEKEPPLPESFLSLFTKPQDAMSENGCLSLAPGQDFPSLPSLRSTTSKNRVVSHRYGIGASSRRLYAPRSPATLPPLAVCTLGPERGQFLAVRAPPTVKRPLLSSRARQLHALPRAAAVFSRARTSPTLPSCFPWQNIDPPEDGAPPHPPRSVRRLPPRKPGRFPPFRRPTGLPR